MQKYQDQPGNVESVTSSSSKPLLHSLQTVKSPRPLHRTAVDSFKTVVIKEVPYTFDHFTQRRLYEVVGEEVCNADWKHYVGHNLTRSSIRVLPPYAYTVNRDTKTFAGARTSASPTMSDSSLRIFLESTSTTPSIDSLKHMV